MLIIIIHVLAPNTKYNIAFDLCFVTYRNCYRNNLKAYDKIYNELNLCDQFFKQ